VDFIKSLFDFDFETFVTPALIRPLYILWIALAGLGSLFFFLTSLLSRQPIAILMALIIVPIMFLVQVVFARMYAEIAFVIFDVNDRLDSLGGRRGGE
jgi:hypothetical protein